MPRDTKTPAATSDGSRKIVHPLYAQWAPTWQMAYDVFEGAGGFLDEKRPYLVPHPREWLDHSVVLKEGETVIKTVPNTTPSHPSAKLTMRRKLARYENVAATILEMVTGALFTQAPTRTFGKGTANDQITEWIKDVDGKATSYDSFLHDAWLAAGVFSHSLVLVEKGAGEATTAADQTPPRLCWYTPLDLLDWLEDEDGKITAVKLLEPAPRKTFGERMTASAVRVRVVDAENWTLYDASGKVIATEAHGFGRLPVAFLYAKRRTLTPVIGKPVMGDPQLYIDLYNLVSECRELLRNQTFGILNVPIGKDGDAEREKNIIGQQSGTANILFTTEQAAFLSPDGANVEKYHEHIDRLGRMIYRLASVPWEGDSRDAESADSRRLKRADLNAVLSKYTDELAKTDDEILSLVYLAMYGDAGAKKQQSDGLSTVYAKVFEAPDLEAVAARAAEMIGLDLGPTATKELKKRTAKVALPHTDEETAKKIDAEIDAQEILTKDEKQERVLEQTRLRLADAVPGKPSGAPMPKEPAA